MKATEANGYKILVGVYAKRTHWRDRCKGKENESKCTHFLDGPKGA